MKDKRHKIRVRAKSSASLKECCKQLSLNICLPCLPCLSTEIQGSGIFIPAPCMKLARSFETGHGLARSHQLSISLDTETLNALFQKEESRHYTTVATVSVMASIINRDTHIPQRIISSFLSIISLSSKCNKIIPRIKLVSLEMSQLLTHK